MWENVSIPLSQIKIRQGIADGTLIVGALFWSLVVTFISAVSNLESISRVIPALQDYSNTELYQFANNYLAIGLLLILLAILPFIFDFIARSYEGLKTESEIQNSIMTRYFYYQLANVYVSVGLGSVASSLHEILANPSSILGILGASLPSFSIFFANLVIIKTFTAVPIEMLRVFPVLDILSVSLCMDKRKCTRRELRTGAFADPPMLYGWIYPNLMMILMIMLTYCCVSARSVNCRAEPQSGPDPPLCLLLADRAVHDAALRVLLRAGVSHVQVPAVVRLYQQLPVGRFHVVRRVQPLDGGAHRRRVHAALLPGHPHDLHQRALLPAAAPAADDPVLLAALQQAHPQPRHGELSLSPCPVI